MQASIIQTKKHRYEGQMWLFGPQFRTSTIISLMISPRSARSYYASSSAGGSYWYPLDGFGDQANLKPAYGRIMSHVFFQLCLGKQLPLAQRIIAQLTASSRAGLPQRTEHRLIAEITLSWGWVCLNWIVYDATSWYKALQPPLQWRLRPSVTQNLQTSILLLS